MTRRLLNLLTLVSLLLCLAVLALWARSRATFDHVRWLHAVEVTPHERDERAFHFFSVRGRLILGRSREQYTPFPNWEGWTEPHPRTGVTHSASTDRPSWANFELDVYKYFETYPEWRRFGFGRVYMLALTNHGGPDLTFDAVAAPHGAAAVAFALLPFAWAVRRWRRWHRRRRGLCGACGYDLRATPGRCPECGAGAAPETPDTAQLTPHAGS